MLLYTDLTVKCICERVYISEGYLRRLYKERLGLSPRAYIQRVKLKKAHTMLRITDKKICEIAHEVGYINVSKFSSSFRREFGISPKEYRKSLMVKNCDVLE